MAILHPAKWPWRFPKQWREGRWLPGERLVGTYGAVPAVHPTQGQGPVLPPRLASTRAWTYRRSHDSSRDVQPDT